MRETRINLMPIGLSLLQLQIADDEESFLREKTAPALIWERPPQMKQEGFIMETRLGPPRSRSGTEPLVFELVKNVTKPNPFTMGLTIGRTENNDVVVADASVSRFHAYFMSSKRDEWSLFDADSRFGTWIGGMKVAPNKPVPIPDGARLKFGEIELLFLLPSSLFDHVKRHVP